MSEQNTTPEPQQEREFDVLVCLADASDKQSLEVEVLVKPGEPDLASPSRIVAAYIAANWTHIVQGAQAAHIQAMLKTDEAKLIAPTSVILGADGKGLVQ